MIEGFIEDKRNGMPVKAICKKYSISEPGLYKHLPPELKDGSSRGKGPNSSKGGCPRKFTDETILIACVDGLSGFSEAIETVFPLAEVQRCIVHHIRYCSKFVNYTDQKLFCKDMKQIYQATTEESASGKEVTMF